MNVLLKYDDPAQAIETVAVIGAFNDYNSAMRQEADGWHFACTLPQGEYPYRFLINGELEMVDPYNGLHDIDSTDKLWSLRLFLNGQWMLEDTFTIEKTSGLVYQRV
ncbi:hypothetical protein ACR6HW_08235 [Fusibacter sp. JL298sf-3]